MSAKVDVSIGVLVARFDEGWRVLITRRPDQTVLGGCWELPGGKVEPNESPVQCLVREFQEEVGLTVQVSEHLPTIEHKYAHAHVRLHPFICTHHEGEAQPLEVAECRWVRGAELDSYRFPAANEQLMQAVKQYLEDRLQIA